MDIKKVELIHQEAVEAGTEKGANGKPLAIPGQPEAFNFIVALKDGTEVTVPNDPLNRHYHEVAAWYKKQKKKPFKFKFED